MRKDDFRSQIKTDDFQFMKRIHSILSAVNHTIVKIRDKKILLDEVCKIIIEKGNYDVTWIELKNEDEEKFKVFASYTDSEHSPIDLELLSNIITENKGDEITLQKNGFSVQNNLHNKTIEAGLFSNSLINICSTLYTFPLIIENRFEGKLRLISNYHQSILDEELELLKEISTDISYALERIKLEDKTIINENKLREVIENSTNLFFSHDSNFLVTYVSPHSVEFIGYTPEEAKVNWTKFLSDNPVNDIGIKRTIEAIKTGKKQEPFELELKTKDGKLVWVLVNETPVVKNGKTESIVGSYTNITERKKITFERDNFFKFSNDIMCIVDLEGNFLASNPAWEKLLGYSNEELKLLKVADLAHPDDVRLLIEARDKAKNGTNVNNFLLRTRCKDGSLKWLSWNSFINENNMYGLGRDVTQLIETENKLKEALHNLGKTNKDLTRLSRAVEQSPVSIVLTDLNGNIEYANPKCLEITGYTVEEVIGQNPKIFKSGEKTPSDYKKLWETISTGNEWQGEFHNKKKNGDLFWELATISPVKNQEGEVISYLAVKEDITERKIMMDQLITAKEEAEEINRIKSNFFSNMSHELRTPLVGIIGFSDMLLDEIKNDNHREYVESILDSGNRLLKTLNTILNISKLEAEKVKLHLETLNIYNEVKYAVDSNRNSAVRKNLNLNITGSEDELYAEIDKKLFRIILNNLITNAIKYTDEGSITINITLKQNESKEYIIVKVIDTGIGISPESYKIIFEEFRQGSEGLNRTFEGVGLGLTIAQKYIKLLNGDISVSSKLGEGSVFSIEIPLVKPKYLFSSESDSSTAKKSSVKAMNTNPNILLVEDDHINRSVTKYFLKEVCELDIVTSGEKALEIVNSKKYDLILMDIALGAGINGLETTKLIREIPEYREVPIIALTAYAMYIEKNKFLVGGCNDYLSKPFTKHELVDKVLSLLQISKK